MGSRRFRDTDYAPVSNALVSPSSDAPLGILDVSTLELLLRSSDQHAPRRQVPTHHEEERPASSELARTYGVSATKEAFYRPKYHTHVFTKPRRRPALTKLEAMDGIQPTPARPAPQRRTVQVERIRQTTSSVVKQERDAVVYAKMNHDGESLDASLPSSTSTRMNGALPVVSTTKQQRRSCPQDRSAGSSNVTKELHRELQWIHTHFPVLRLANPKCSLALRQRLFIDTIHKNLLRAYLRCALLQWKWVVRKYKEIEASKLKAFDRMVAMFNHAVRDHMVHHFGEWVRYVKGCQEMERVAAVLVIQDWFVGCRQRREGRQNLLALSLARALTVANAHATRIQQRYRVHAAQLQLRNAREAATRIQRCVRTTKRRRISVEQEIAARNLEELYAQMRRNQQLEMLTMRNRARQVRRIGRAWRQYATWRNQLVHDYVAHFVDQVEFMAAVCSIQRHLRGYQCRFRVKRTIKASICIQHAWRQCIQRKRARQQRKILLLTHKMAACCLQRTFQRNRERKKHREIMQKSSRPMFMRALGATATFRIRYYVPIVKSAVTVIQSSWRRHVAHQQWLCIRDVAVRRIQQWKRRVLALFAWQRTVVAVVILHRESQRQEAARRLQHWLRMCTERAMNAKQAIATRQLMEMLTFAMTIQRYCRRKRDPWRRLLRNVLTLQLPQCRAAATAIQTCWRQFLLKKRRLIELYGINGELMPCSLGLHDLQDHLVGQKREKERRLRASKTIQKAFRHWLARREGKLLLKRYRVLFQRDLRRRHQREIIHVFLVEKQDERQRRHQARGTGSNGTPSSSSSASPGSIDTPQTHESPMETMGGDSPKMVPGDDPDVVQSWSDEYQSYYWFNTRTGESAWCT